jgi:hypothetical protein
MQILLGVFDEKSPYRPAMCIEAHEIITRGIPEVTQVIGLKQNYDEIWGTQQCKKLRKSALDDRMLDRSLEDVKRFGTSLSTLCSVSSKYSILLHLAGPFISLKIH